MKLKLRLNFDECMSKNFSEAQNLVRRIRDDFPTLKIIAEHVRMRDPVPRLPSHDLDFFHDRPAVDDSKEPMRNVLELSKRYEIDIGIRCFPFPTIDYCFSNGCVALRFVSFRFVFMIAKSKDPLPIQPQCISPIR